MSQTQNTQARVDKVNHRNQAMFLAAINLLKTVLPRETGLLRSYQYACEMHKAILVGEKEVKTRSVCADLRTYSKLGTSQKFVVYDHVVFTTETNEKYLVNFYGEAFRVKESDKCENCGIFCKVLTDGICGRCFKASLPPVAPASTPVKELPRLPRNNRQAVLSALNALKATTPSASSSYQYNTTLGPDFQVEVAGRKVAVAEAWGDACFVDKMGTEKRLVDSDHVLFTNGPTAILVNFGGEARFVDDSDICGECCLYMMKTYYDGLCNKCGGQYVVSRPPTERPQADKFFWQPKKVPTVADFPVLTK